MPSILLINMWKLIKKICDNTFMQFSVTSVFFGNSNDFTKKLSSGGWQGKNKEALQSETFKNFLAG